MENLHGTADQALLKHRSNVCRTHRFKNILFIDSNIKEHKHMRL
jgi:hypothetical protein